MILTLEKAKPSTNSTSDGEFFNSYFEDEGASENAMDIG